MQAERPESRPESPPDEPHRRAWPQPLEWLALAASLALTLQYSWLLDDAFVYYRYVDNLLYLERGLVFNRGEYVEGYSSPLWCLLLVPLRWIGLDWWLLVRVVGLACAAGTWALLVALGRRMAPRTTPSLNFPLLYLAFLYAVQTYFTSGVETPAVQLCAAGFALYVVSPGSRAAQVLLGLAPMVRHELALAFAIGVAWSWSRTRRVPWMPIVVCAATLGPWLLFRVAYYADLFPNTFYLKDEVQIARGLRYVHDTLVAYGVYVLVPLFAVLAIALRRARVTIDGGARLVMLAAAVAVTLYVVKIGGDPRHYRYLAFPFVVLACAAGGLIEHAHARWLPSLRPANARIAGLAIAAGAFSLYPRQLSKHPFERDAVHTKVDEINDAQFHRLKPDLAASPWTLAPVIDTLDDDALDHIYGESPIRPEGPTLIRTEYARWLASGEDPASYPITTNGWCASAWRFFTHTIVHWDGLTDPFLSHVSAGSWRAAHKRDLHPLAVDLVAVRRSYGYDAAAFESSIAAGTAAPWIAANRASILLIARKSANRHSFADNLPLAFTRVPRIEPAD
jgi:hypothetical protein